MKQYFGNIEPMESLFSLMIDWLGNSNRAIVASYYFSSQKQKNILLRMNADGTFKEDSYQEKVLHKTIQRSIAKTTCQSEDPGNFHHLFLEKFFESRIADKKNPILVLPFVNAEDGKKDLLFIQLRQSSGVTKNGSSGSQISLNTSLVDEIVIVSRLIYAMQIDYREQFDSVKKLLNHKFAELESLKEELEQMKVQMGHEKMQLARAELDLMVKKYKSEYIIENSASQKIMDTEVDTDRFKSALREAYLNAKLIFNDEEKLRINGENLYFEAPSQGIKKSKIEEGAKMRKVEKYLNDLEAAAVAVLKDGDRLTAENIGRKFDPIRIPAAISDYNKRHQDRIRMLMINRPNDWPTLREFRPIINILTGINSSEESKILQAPNQ